MKEVEYPQGKHLFVGNLSMIDVLMWNDKEAILSLLDEFVIISETVSNSV